jgi:hypothetical protein
MADNQTSSWATGFQGDYYWLETTEQDLDSLLHLCPGVFVGRYLAVTSFDSGRLFLDKDQESGAWVSRNDIAYSPKIVSVNGLPHDGYDEWYLFDAPVDLGVVSEGNVFVTPTEVGRVKIFANFYGFSLKDSLMEPLAAIFWKQLEWMSPHSYIAETDSRLIYASRDEKAFAGVRSSLIGPVKHIQ